MHLVATVHSKSWHARPTICRGQHKTSSCATNPIDPPPTMPSLPAASRAISSAARPAEQARPRAAAAAAASSSSRRQALWAAAGAVLAAVAPQPARAAAADAAPASGGSETAAAAAAAPSPYVQELLRRSRENKEQYDRERLQAYYKKNFKDYFEFDGGSSRAATARGIKPDTQAAIQQWLQDNAD